MARSDSTQTAAMTSPAQLSQRGNRFVCFERFRARKPKQKEVSNDNAGGQLAQDSGLLESLEYLTADLRGDEEGRGGEEDGRWVRAEGGEGVGEGGCPRNPQNTRTNARSCERSRMSSRRRRKTARVASGHGKDSKYASQESASS